MLSSKKYIVMFLILILASGLKFSSLWRSAEQVETFRGANLEAKVWNPLIAESVNEKEIFVLVDNKELKSSDTGIFMDENLTLMLPVSILRDSFNCSAHLYGTDQLLIEKRSDEISFLLDEPVVTVNKAKKEITSSMVYANGTYYVPADTVSRLLNFSYQWDIGENRAVVLNNAEGDSILPAKYDLRERGRTPSVKDQGRFGTCWAFAALSAMESRLMPEERLELSPDHMSLKNSFYLKQTDGGNYTMGMAYLTAWQGPVYEADDPYGDKMSPDGLNPVKHVQEIQIIGHKDYEEIKEAVFKYGGVQTSIYSALGRTIKDSEYYNAETSSYCYIGTKKSNHDVLIIGWDDNYSRDNFKMEVEGDGAFICQNSWGSRFGQDGVFYISYYDVNVGSHNVVYTGIEGTDNYDRIYQTDLCGWVGQLGYNQESIYGANIYTAEGDEQLRAAGFYAVGKDTEYRLYVVKDFEGTESLKEDRILVAQGKLRNSGYYTIPFNRNVFIAAGEQYAVILYISTPGSDKPLAIEYQADEFTSTVDITDGQGYISAMGNRWESLEETQNSNLCLKVYSDYR
mgnify:CR=1 FL=1